MPKIVLASSNLGKINELQTACRGLPLTLVPQSDYHVTAPLETGHTFVENAILKARYAAEKTGYSALADDSGLVVPALGGAPGIFSARYAGENASDLANITKLLSALANEPASSASRKAYFYCVLVLMIDAADPAPLISEGIWHGHILSTPVGELGFGYDPVFYVPAENKSAAELSLAIKNKISHRGQALQCLIQKLSEKLCMPSQLKT